MISDDTSSWNGSKDPATIEIAKGPASFKRDPGLATCLTTLKLFHLAGTNMQNHSQLSISETSGSTVGSVVTKKGNVQ